MEIFSFSIGLIFVSAVILIAAIGIYVYLYME